MSDTRIYIVDPDKDERNALVENLQSVEYKVEALSSGKDILRKVRKNGPHVVILDLDIKDMDPFELIPKLRTKNNDVQIITITHNSTSKMRKKVAKMGVLFHSTKPKHLYQLKNIVDVTLEYENRRSHKTAV